MEKNECLHLTEQEIYSFLQDPVFLSTQKKRYIELHLKRCKKCKKKVSEKNKKPLRASE